MTPITFIHAADFHLDAPFRGGRPGYGQLRRADVRRAFSATVALAQQEKVQLLLLCGDLFEQDGVSRDPVAFVQQALRTLTRTQVVILPGNHDPLTPDSWYHAAAWPDHVHILPVLGTQAAALDLPEIDAHLAGYGFTGVVHEAPCFDSLPAPRKDRYNLLLIHGSLDAPPSARAYHRVTTAQLRQTGYDYVAMGHYHRGFIAEGTPVVANPGSPEPMGFDEQGPHGVLSGSISCNGSAREVRVAPVPLATREYVEKTMDVTAAQTRDALLYLLAEALHDLDSARHLPLVRLVGAPLHPPDMEAVSAWFDDSWLLYRLVDDTHPPLATDGGLTPGSLAGVFCDRLAQRIAEAEAAGDTQRVAMLRQARHMGLEALAYGVVHFGPDGTGG